jgi:hypothetical protein
MGAMLDRPGGGALPDQATRRKMLEYFARF